MNKRNNDKIKTFLIVSGAILVCLFMFESVFAVKLRNAEYEQRISFNAILSDARNAGVQAITASVNDAQKSLVSLLSMKNFKKPYKEYAEIAYLTKLSDSLKSLNRIASSSVVNPMTADTANPNGKAEFDLSKEIFSLCYNLSSVQAPAIEKIALKMRNGSELNGSDIAYLKRLNKELSKISFEVSKIDFSKSKSELKEQSSKIEEIGKELSRVKPGTAS